MNNNQYELIGESIWDTYRNIAYLLSEISLGYIAKKAASGFKARQFGKLGKQDLGQPGGRIAGGGVSPSRDDAMTRIRTKLGSKRGTPEGSPEAKTFQKRFFDLTQAGEAWPKPVLPPEHPEAGAEGGPSPLAQRKVRPELAGSKRRKWSRYHGNGNGNGK